jgi:crossover junction endodeoxyribonuclease RuvC
MITVGLDLSLTGTGITILTESDLVNNVCPMTRLVSTKPHVAYPDHTYDLLSRINCINTVISDYVSEYRSEQCLVVIEGYAMGFAGKKKGGESVGPSTGRLFDLGELGGVVKYTLYNRGIKFILVTPGQLKKFATGKGNGPKSNVRVGVLKKWTLDFEDDNICDSYVLARMGFHYMGIGLDLCTQEQLKVIAAIEKVPYDNAGKISTD